MSFRKVGKVRTLLAVFLGFWVISATAETPMVVTASPVTVACKSQDDVNLAFELVKSQDFSAFDKLLSSGRCIGLETGTPVTMVEQSLYHGMYRVRPRGSVSTFWLLRSAAQ